MKKPDKSTHPRDHLANERTFLAWIRTSIGIMAFGFVVEKFSLVMKHMPMEIQQQSGLTSTPHLPWSLQGYSSIFGIFLVVFGALVCLLAFLRYKKAERQIAENIYQPSMLLNIMLTLFVLLLAIFLIIYLNHGIFMQVTTA